MNPGSHAPQACILIQSSQQNTGIPAFGWMLDDGPALGEYNPRILKTLDDMLKNGKSRSTQKSTFYALREMNRKVDLMNPESVKEYIALKECSPATKEKIAKGYNYFVLSNELQWQKPIYKYDSKVPIAPTKEQAEAIISSAPSINAATIFRVLLESGFEGEELHGTTEKDIDTEQGIITVAGHKQHSGRNYKFKKATTEMLKLYISKHHQKHPFPRPKIMAQAWRKARARASQKLSRPDLNKIPLKGLRNLSGIIVWQKTKDPWTVMLHMGQKKLDTTQHYLSAMTQQPIYEQEYTTIAVKTGEPDSLQKAIELLEQGFKVSTEMDGYKLFSKPK